MLFHVFPNLLKGPKVLKIRESVQKPSLYEMLV